MLINTGKMISLSEANEKFSRIAQIVDQEKTLIIMKNNKPKYVILDFEQFSSEATSDEDKLDIIADKILKENMLAFKTY
ncbi:type II toxin-antitoxin system Phd/YefM family antitoxin [Clostridium akagii]|uniref:type II toxin-antitoxin system Phd/YefM family antitoxin n=1 Tax=Clostridium akagii TaxID=91623 RepID=UPI00047C8191|nr:type II toxin-antitoxin system Phd/YefM family antitoxin [Clostridium akagii]